MNAGISLGTYLIIDLRDVLHVVSNASIARTVCSSLQTFKLFNLHMNPDSPEAIGGFV
jgi:hypothetical protein